MYIVAWVVKVGNTNPKDEWEAFEDEVDAYEKYKELINKDYTYTASVCEVIESTDYDC